MAREGSLQLPTHVDVQSSTGEQAANELHHQVFVCIGSSTARAARHRVPQSRDHADAWEPTVTSGVR